MGVGGCFGIMFSVCLLASSFSCSILVCSVLLAIVNICARDCSCDVFTGVNAVEGSWRGGGGVPMWMVAAAETGAGAAGGGGRTGGEAVAAWLAFFTKRLCAVFGPCHFDGITLLCCGKDIARVLCCVFSRPSRWVRRVAAGGGRSGAGWRGLAAAGAGALRRVDAVVERLAGVAVVLCGDARGCAGAAICLAFVALLSWTLCDTIAR